MSQRVESFSPHTFSSAGGECKGEQRDVLNGTTLLQMHAQIERERTPLSVRTILNKPVITWHEYQRVKVYASDYPTKVIEIVGLPTSINDGELVEIALNFRKLQVLDLSGCKGIKRLAFLYWLKDLRVLNLSCCSGLGDISALNEVKKFAEMGSLATLGLAYCTVSDLTFLTRIRRLTSIDLTGCEADFSPLREMELVEVDLSDTSFSDLTLLARSRDSLKVLILLGCTEIEDFSALGSFRGLIHLDLSWCRLRSFAWVDQIRGIKRLFLTGLEGIQDLSPFLPLRNLEVLDLSRTGVTSLQRIEAFPHLVELKVTGCEELGTLSTTVLGYSFSAELSESEHGHWKRSPT